MSCSGCTLSWFYKHDAITSGSVLNVISGYAQSPTFQLMTSGNVQWGTITMTVLNASNGMCGPVTGGPSGCFELSGCGGIRGINYTLVSGYGFHVIGYDANTHQPFHCGESEYFKFYGETISGRVSTDYTIGINCDDC